MSLKSLLFRFNMILFSQGAGPYKKRVLVPLAVSLIFFGCAQKQPRYTVDSGFVKNQIEIVRRVVSTPSRIRSVSAFAKVYISVNGKKRRAKEVIIIDRTGNMRFESLNPFGQTSLLLIKRGSRVFFHNLMENSYAFMGEHEPVLYRILGVPISLEDVRQVVFQDFSGALTDLGLPDVVAEGDMFVVKYRGHIKKIRLKDDGTVSSVQYQDNSGKVRFTVSYLKYTRKKDIFFPKKIRINFPEKDIELGFNFKDASINDFVDINSFAVTIPANASRYR